MSGMNIEKLLDGTVVIPAVRTPADFEYALLHARSTTLILLFGDINSLPAQLAQAQKYHKRLFIHLDLLEGIGRDKAGIRFLARLGVTGIITTKNQLVKTARDEGMIVIQRLFVMDSEALRHGVQLLKSGKPDAVEVLPASVPEETIKLIISETKLPVLAGGLLSTEAQVKLSLANGTVAVSTSKKELWAVK